MPRKKNPKKPEVEHAHLSVRVEHYEASARAGINHYAFSPQDAWDLEDEDPLYEFAMELRIFGIVTYPEHRAGNEFELTVYGEGARTRRLNLKLKDIQARDKNGVPQYRQYRGKQIPVYDPPSGMGMIEKVRGKQQWTAWLHGSSQFAADALALLGHSRELFLGIHERKAARARWIQAVTLQTTDPADE